jgi:hypothetical protein
VGGKFIGGPLQGVRESADVVDLPCHGLGVVAGEQSMHLGPFRGGALAEGVGRQEFLDSIFRSVVIAGHG